MWRKGSHIMANQEYLDILKQGVQIWNQWREEHPNIEPDLSEARLCGALLSGANLSEANLFGADLSKATLSKADLSRANLLGTDLSRADLTEANLTEANLSGAELMLADLSEANLIGANLSGAYLRYANLDDTLVQGIKYLNRKQSQNISKWKRFRRWFYSRSIMRGKYQGIRVASCYGNAIFKRDAEDQDFLDTLEDQWKGTWRIGLFWAWGLIDYGRSMLAVFVIAGFLIMFFGSIYLVFPGLVSYSASHPQTWFSPYYYSIVTFTTLGFGDVSANWWCGEMVVSLQVILGYLTLGLLISILANKVARRS